MPDLRVTRITTLVNLPDQNKDKCSVLYIVDLYQRGQPVSITHATFQNRSRRPGL
jgi:hypothetical protein